MALSYFLVYFILTFLLVAGQTPKYVLKGEGDHLKPNIPGQPSSILWKHNGNKIVEFDGSEEQVYHPYKHRITLNWITAELKITDLRYEDSGDYELEVDINDELYSSQSKLEVIDKVATPTISCALNKGSSSDGSEVKATLLCSAEPRKPESLMKFEWSSQGKLHPGKILPISLGDTQIDEEYVCIVRNPLSSEKATFRAKDCYHEKNSPIALVVGLFVLVLLLGAAVGTFLFLKWKQKACFAKRQRGDVKKQSPAKAAGEDNQGAGGFRGVVSKGLQNNASEEDSASPLLPPETESSKPNQGLNTSNSEKDQDQAKELGENTEEVHPSKPPDSEKENELNLTGEKPENTAPDPKLTPDQSEADVNGEKEDHDKNKTSGDQATVDKSQGFGGLVPKASFLHGGKR